jgi:HSP20 family protein
VVVVTPIAPEASPALSSIMKGVLAMLMRTDPFRELDRLTQQALGNPVGTWIRPTAMPMDAYRAGEQFVVAFDLPGVSPDVIELDVERNVLTVKAERRPDLAGENVEMQVAERPLGVFSRQLFLGETLDAEHIDASYDAGVLTLRIPIAQKAKPRKIAIANADGGQRQINA